MKQTKATTISSRVEVVLPPYQPLPATRLYQQVTAESSDVEQAIMQAANGWLGRYGPAACNLVVVGSDLLVDDEAVRRTMQATYSTLGQQVQLMSDVANEEQRGQLTTLLAEAEGRLPQLTIERLTNLKGRVGVGYRPATPTF